MKKLSILLLTAILAFSCGDETTNFVLLKTSMGDVTIELYDETPLHRDNFQKLVKEGYYDGLLFHRVINEFMIQGGDPESKGAPKSKHLGNGGPGYTIPAELSASSRCFHKKGALSAARKGDNVNPEKASSGSQFYIVTGRKFSEQELGRMEQQQMMKMRRQFFSEISSENQDKIDALKEAKDQNGLKQLQKEMLATADAKLAADPDLYSTDIEKKVAYTEEGGTPHLDGSYTVFGQVVKGIEVVEAISKTETGAQDRPLEDVIMSARFVKAPR